MPQNLDTLLKRWRDGKLTNEELAILKDLLKSRSHEIEFLSILESIEGTEQYAADAEKSYEKTYDSVISQIDQSRKPSGITLAKMAAIAASVVLITSAALWVLSTNPVQDIKIDRAQVEYTGKQFLKLPDGTAVTLNEGSHLVYDSNAFKKTNREVTLIGEAYFDVAHISGKPFIVHTQGVSTEVLGTAFNIHAFEGQKEIVVTVSRGEVKVRNAEKVFDNLLPNESLIINPKTFGFTKQTVKAENAVAWKSRMLIIDDVSMDSAAKIIAEHFSTKIQVSESLDSCRVTAYFTKGETLDQVLDIISLSKNGNYKVTKGIASITGTCE